MCLVRDTGCFIEDFRQLVSDLAIPSFRHGSKDVVYINGSLHDVLDSALQLSKQSTLMTRHEGNSVLGTHCCRRHAKNACHVLSSCKILHTPLMNIDIAHDVIEMGGTK